jgi:excinuclease ABC subunit B
MRRALEEMDRRRRKQAAYNAAHGIKPRTIQKAIADLAEFQTEAKREGLRLMREAAASKPLTPGNVPHLVETLERQMREAADSLDFELAALLRDQIFELREMAGPRRTHAKKSRR